MFSLIFYCGLITSVVSAHFNNDTSHDGDELDINTTLSTLASDMIPVSKNCVLEMKENEISQIVELFNSNPVNVVDIHISFASGCHEGQLFSDFHVLLSNPIGQEILYALERWEFKFLTWTLKAGIKTFTLDTKRSLNECFETKKNATDFAFESTQHIVDNINLTTNYQVCSSFKETSSGRVNLNCCQMTKPYLAIKFNNQCPKRNSLLFGNDLPLPRYSIYFMMYVFANLYVMWLLLVFLSRTEFDLKYPEYYKLEESLMSPSSILLKVIWDGNSRVVSFIRSLVLIGVFSYFWYLMSLSVSEQMILSLFGSFSLSFLVFNLSTSGSSNSSKILDKMKKHRNRVLRNRFFRYYQGSGLLSKNDKKVDFEIVVNLIIWPFNLNFWRNVMNMLYDNYTDFYRCVTEKFSNCILHTLALCCYSVLCFICVSILFCFLVLFATTFSLFFPYFLLRLLCVLEYDDDNFCKKALSLFHAFGLFSSFFISVMIIILSIMSFLLGCFLNLFCFIHYFAFFSVLTFYCFSYWKTMEEKYFVLKQLIYETCRETQGIDNCCIPNRHPEPNEKVLLVVSKVLYDDIRKRLLSYDTNFFYFGFKMVWYIVFSSSVLAVIKMLNEFNVTGLFQVVTTASLGVMPYIFNMVALKTSEAKTKAWNENLKLKVKNLVKELIRRNPELARTVLIIEQDNIATVNNPSIVEEYVQYVSSV